jgi:predicted phage tail protein
LTYGYFVGVDLPPIGDYALDTTAPTFAGIKTATATSHNTIDVTWDPATDEVESESSLVYVIWFGKQGSSEKFCVLGPGGTTSRTIEDLEPDTTYELYMQCRDTSGNHSYDATPVVLTATTAADPSVDIAAPTFGGITNAVVLNENTVRLSWAAGTDTVTPQNQLVYEIHYSTTENDDFEVKGESAAGATSYDVRNLQPGVKYYFRVRCRDAAGNRSES